ncbi:MAG: cyclic nucleotide-binding domain-containing protein, partial [Bacteroidota bacterium]
MENLSQHIRNTTSISDAHLKIVLNQFVEKRYAKKEHLQNAYEPANELFFVIQGCLRTYINDYNGVEHNITFSIENWWAGDMPSFLTNQTAVYGIQALEETTVLSISKKGWDLLHQNVPAFVKHTRILFRNNMFSQQNRIVQNLSYTAMERYDSFIENYPEQFQR